jgi:hypothetical protein
MAKRKCLFCNRDADSKEHVRPQWILKQLCLAKMPSEQKPGLKPLHSGRHAHPIDWVPRE